MGHAKTIARNSLWSLADSLLGMVSSVGCSVAVARVMGLDQLGYSCSHPRRPLPRTPGPAT